MRHALKLTLAYDGTRFVGWQRQADGDSIQGLLEDALARFEGAPVTVHGAGRTDAGVHALGQVASVQVTASHAVDVVARALNACLPPEIRVTTSRGGRRLSRRFSARSKTYRYVDPQRADCRARSSAPTSGTSRTRSIAARCSEAAAAAGRDARLRGVPERGQRRDDNDADDDGIRVRRDRTTRRGSSTKSPATAFCVTWCGRSSGTLVEIGRGQRPASSMAALLAGGRRAEAGATAPPHGLFLVRVDYD